MHDVPSLKRNWFTTNIQVKYLQLCDIYVWAIVNNAFNVIQFAELRTLEIKKVPIMALTDGVFNGLTKLKTLLLDHLMIHAFAPNLLAPVPNLEKFTLQYCDNQPLVLDYLFGYNNLTRLHVVTIQHCNLNNTITKTTFTGLQSVKELRLEYNQIKRIGLRSFNIPLQTLLYLSLEGNYLRTLPGIFLTKRHSSLQLNIADNQWHCNCALKKFQFFKKRHKGYLAQYCMPFTTATSSSNYKLRYVYRTWYVK